MSAKQCQAQRPVSANKSGSLGPALGTQPAPLALRREAAADVIGVSVESFDRYVRPTLPVCRLGTVRVYPVVALEEWLAAHADSPMDELEARR